MKKVYLLKITQHGETCYVGKMDPRDLVRVAVKVEMGEVQDAQRPLNKKRVQDISKYVAEENGILPNTLTIATKDNSFEIKPLEGVSDVYYINFPSEECEFPMYQEKIDIMDGQHRLYSFLDEMCKLNSDTPYDIGFTIYDKPTLSQRRKIFVSCNEKQEKVSGNLLMWFKIQLDMATDEEKNFYSVVQKLSEEYPLRGHIIMSAENIKNGVKAKEVMAAMKQAKIHNMRASGKTLTEELKVKVICTYLSAWEKFASFKFATSKLKEAGPAIKMAGLKYMLLLLPTIWERALNTRSPFTEKFVGDTLNELATHLGVERERFFTCDQHKYNFRDRTVTDEFAEKCNSILSAIDAGDFNPLG
ncbi:MAG: DGQHR domain-containing protein [Alistipes sp.]|nr:DGQHR domain-containing protein [Alistipes sp.]